MYVEFGVQYEFVAENSQFLRLDKAFLEKRTCNIKCLIR